jgi:DNA repair/transcription protein MET18/MMS19
MIKNAISTKNHCSPYARISMLHFMQLLINKFDAPKEVFIDDPRDLVQIVLDLAANCLNKTGESQAQNTYQTLAYFTAAYLAAGGPAANDLVRQMIAGLGDPVVGRKVAQSFRVLLAPSEILVEKNFCIIRKLRKQRLYSNSVKKLVEMWRGAQTKELKENCLIALAGVFAYMESKILDDNAEAVFPVILESTNVGDDFTMYTSITVLRALITAKPEIATGHLDSIISRMTDRTHNTYDSPSDASVKCRVAALEVLALLVSHMERGALLKRKAKIMAELDAALDDCSRTVRSAAERTKMRYFNLVEADA